MKAYLIDPFAKAITEIDFDGSIEVMYRLCGCELLEAVGLNADNDTVYVDEEGLCKDLSRTAFFELTGDARSVALAGKGIVVGTDSEGYTCEPSATIEQIKPMITWATIEELRARYH